jgi:hypothetical protein
MPEMVKSSETKLFADDSLLFRTINNQADSVLLQNDLTSLQDWEDKWQMSFNAKKCQVIRITPKNRPPLPTTYKLHGHTLDTVDASKYLGESFCNNTLSAWLLMVRKSRLSSTNSFVSDDLTISGMSLM